jgi:hypothetical protein
LKNLLQDLTFTTTTPLKEDEIEIYSLLIIGEENFKKKQKSNGAEMGNFDSEKGNESLCCCPTYLPNKMKRRKKKSNEKGSKRGNYTCPEAILYL